MRLLMLAPALAVDVTGQHLSDVVKTMAGNFFVAVLAILGVAQMLRRRFLAVVVLLGLAAFAAIFVYSPALVRDLSDAFVRVLEGQ
jgi:hypothetical protein